MPTRLLLCCLLLATFLGACTTSTKAPKLTIQSAELTERTPQGMVVTFTILADNPNSDALPLRDVTYGVSLAGKHVFSGTRSAEATVRRYGTQTFTLPAAIPAEAGGGMTGSEPFVINGSLRYLVAGALAETLFDIHVLRPSTDFSGAGVVDLSVVKAKAAPNPAGAAQPKPATDSPGPSPD